MAGRLYTARYANIPHLHVHVQITRCGHTTAVSAQPRIPSNVPRPFPVLGVGSGHETSYRYTTTIAGKIFNYRRVVDQLDQKQGAADMEWNCSSNYWYEPCGHVVTGDLSIIRDVKQRNLIKKGPMYREQNNIDWKVNARNCKEAVSKYMRKWASRMEVDRRVLRDWEKTVHECIDKRVRSLTKQHVHKRKKHVLRNKVH